MDIKSKIMVHQLKLTLVDRVKKRWKKGERDRKPSDSGEFSAGIYIAVLCLKCSRARLGRISNI